MKATSKNRAKQTVFCGALLLSLFCGSSVVIAETLRLGLQSFLSYAPTFIALDKGYFRDEGLDVKTTMIRGGGTSAFSALIAGQLEIEGGAVTASLINSVIRGAKMKVIADKGQNRPNYSTNELWITKSLSESGVKTPAGLKGKRIATSGPGSSDWIILGMLAEKYGLSLPKKDVEAVLLDAPERPKALESGTVDGAVLVEPFIANVDKSKAVRLAGIIDALPVFQTAVFYTAEDFLNKHRSTIEKFRSGLRKATEQYLKNPVADDLVAIFSKYTKVKPEVIKRSTPVYFSADTKVDRNALRALVEFLFRNKLIDRPVSLEQFVDRDAM